MKSFRLRLTPPGIFASVSLLLIVLIVLGITFTQSSFYGQAIIDREAVIIRDMVDALVLEQEQEHQLYPTDLDYFQAAGSKERLERSFDALKKVSGVTLVKIFRPDMTIVWSSEPSLVGKQFVTHHPDDLRKALRGEVRAVFNPGQRTLETAYMFPRLSLIEFYVPFSFTTADKLGSLAVSGAMAIYRSPHELNQTIQHGLFLLWLVTGVGGLILFGAMYTLFRSVYYRQRQAESQFARLSTDHTRLVQMEKLSAMGQLVSEIAHQLNSPLVGVVNLAELAEREVDDTARVKELLHDIRQAGDHCRNFVQRMLRFNQVARFEPQRIDLKEILHETIAFLRQSLSSHPEVTLNVPEGSTTLDADPVLLRHALFNVIHNASLAAPGSPIAIDLIAAEGSNAPGWRLEISDRGPGLAPDVMTKLFTPFFTTREGGTGLGLSVAQHILLQHGGSIRGENRPGGGALFVLWLPAQMQR